MFDIFLNMPRVLTILGFWIYQGSEYVSGLQYVKVLNAPGFEICQGYTGFWISEYAWIIPEYAWLNLNMPECVWICGNMCEYAWSHWIVFVLHFPTVIPCVLKRVVTCLNVYGKLEVMVWRNMRLFSWRDKIWFFPY